MTYTPGDGFYFERLGLTTDANEGCDLEALFGKELGHSSITTKAVYPYEPVDYPPVTSEPLVKTVKSLWLKKVYEFSKGTSAADQNVRIIVAKAQDIDGNPFVGEEVCFNATANSGVTAFGGHVTDTEGLLGSPGAVVNLSGSSVLDPADEGSNHLCETTNSQGLAAIEVTNSTESEVDVTTHYINEGITRDNLFDFSTNASGKKAKEAKEAEEKKKHEEEAAAKMKKHEEEAAAEKKANEETAAAEKKKHEEEAAAEKKANEEAAAKEVEEKKTTAEKEAATKAREEKVAAEKARREGEETAAAKARAEKEAVEKARREGEEAAKQPVIPLVPQLPGSLGGTSSAVPSGGVSASIVSSPLGATKANAAKYKAKKHKKAKRVKAKKKHKGNKKK